MHSFTLFWNAPVLGKKMSTYIKYMSLHNIMSSHLNVLLKIQCAIYIY